MSQHILTLFTNLLFILVVLFLYQFWLDRRERTYEDQKKILIICASMCIVFSMSFPLYLNDEFIMDLRHIPLSIGVLYGGIYGAIPLVLVTLGYRFLLGGTGVVSSICICLLVVVLGLLFSKKYLTWSVRKRVTWATVLSLLTSCFVFLCFYAIVISYEYISFQLDETTAIYTFILYIIFHTIGTGIVAYAFEKINSAIQMKHRVIQSEKIELISHLAASISHEVRNPLTASRGFMQLLLGDTSVEKKNEYVSIAIQELDHAEKIITDYLTFAKPLEDHQDLLDVEKECLYVMEVIRPLAHMNAVKLTANLSPIYIYGGRSSFQQCLLNMTRNGIEAIENGGTLHIETLSDDDYITLLISDTGKGMTREQLKRLGEPYFSTKGSKGTGLGMMVVYSIIHSMNGSIQVRSEVDKGTCFQITLPRVQNNSRE